LHVKRLIALLLGVALVAGVAVVAGPSLVARPVYSVSQLQAGLTPRHNVWGGRTVWVRAVAILGRDVGTLPNTVLLFDQAPAGSSAGFSFRVKQPNLAFTVLSWEARIAHAVPALRWVYAERPGVYRVRFFRPTWCLSCPAGQLE
jgi:hypothetical protein